MRPAVRLCAMPAADCVRAVAPRGELPDQFAPAPATGGAIAERVVPMEARHPGQSGFRLSPPVPRPMPCARTARRLRLPASISRPTSGMRT